MKLTGIKAIECAEANNLWLNKYADPIEDAREGLTISEARKVASEDPSLIWLEIGMIWETEKSRPEDFFGYRVAEISDGMETSYARIGRVQSLDKIVRSYMRDYALDGLDRAEVVSNLTVIIHPRFSATSEGEAAA